MPSARYSTWTGMGALEESPLVEVGAALLLVGVTSPSAVATPPKRVLSKAQTFLMPVTTEVRLDVSNTSVWFVCWKQSAHWGNTAWNVSVHAHLITSMKAPGLKMIMEKLAKTGAAAAQLLILE